MRDFEIFRKHLEIFREFLAIFREFLEIFRAFYSSNSLQISVTNPLVWRRDEDSRHAARYGIRHRLCSSLLRRTLCAQENHI